MASPIACFHGRSRIPTIQHQMPYYDPPFNRVKRDPATDPPFGKSPEGHWIVSAEELPTLSIPKRVVVTRDSIEFDGWVFPLAYVSKSLLVWMQESFLRWLKEDDSEKNREWVEGIAEAFQYGIAGKL